MSELASESMSQRLREAPAERSEADDERSIVQLEAGGGGLFAFEAITEQFPIGERGAVHSSAPTSRAIALTDANSFWARFSSTCRTATCCSARTRPRAGSSCRSRR